MEVNSLVYRIPACFWFIVPIPPTKEAFAKAQQLNKTNLFCIIFFIVLCDSRLNHCYLPEGVQQITQKRPFYKD